MTTAQSPELQNQIAQWRAKCLANTITAEELREAIKLMRGDRRAALDASRKAKRGPVKSADDLLNELEDL